MIPVVPAADSGETLVSSETKRSHLGWLFALYIGSMILSTVDPNVERICYALTPWSGIVLAGLLLAPRGVRPGIFAGVAAGQVAFILFTDRENAALWSLTAIGIAGLAGGTAWITGRAGRVGSFQYPREILALIGTAASVCVLSSLAGFSSTKGTAVESSWSDLRMRWMADGLSFLLFTPALTTALAPRSVEQPRSALRWAHRMEWLCLLGLALMLVWFTFGPLHERLPILPNRCLLVLPIVWAAYRFNAREASLLTLAVGVSEVVSTLLSQKGMEYRRLTGEVVEIQAFAAVQGIASLLLIAVRAEKRAMEQALRRTEDRLHRITSHVPDTGTYLRHFTAEGAPSNLRICAGVAALRGLSAEQLARDPAGLDAQILESDREGFLATMRECVRTRTSGDGEMQIRREDGEIRCIRFQLLPTLAPDGGVEMEVIETDLTALRNCEAALRASEEKFVRVFRGSPAALALRRLTDGKLVEVSASMERFTGYSRGEMMHLSLAELGLWEDDADRLRFFAELEREGQVYDRPFQFRNAQRERMSVQLSGVIIELNGERCLLSSITDVTPLERTRGELQRVNRALRTINACSQIIAHGRDEESLVRQHCTTIVSIGGYHLAWVAYANRDPGKTVTAKAWAGVSAEIAQSWRVTWGDDERGQGPAGTAIRTGRPVVSGDMLKDPRLALFRKGIIQLGLRSEIALPIRVGEEVIGSLAISTSERHAFETEEVNLLARLADDLGFGIRALRERERKETAEVEVRRLLTEAETSRSVLLSILEDEIRSETALRASEEQFRSALEHSPIGMGLVGLDGRWIMVNEAFCNLMGYERSEVLQRPFEGLTHSDDLEASLERMKQLREEKLDACEFEKRYVHKQGHSVWVRANVSLVRNPDGTPRHFIKQIQDITERRKAEQALVESNRRYARHEAALSTLSRTYALAAENLGKVLRDIVEVVAWTLEVDRVGVWTYNKSRTALVCLEFFQRPTNRHSEGQELTRKGFESYFSALEASEVVAVTQVSTDPRTAELASAYLSPSGVGALLDTPIRSREGKSGVLCCEHLGGDRAWTADEQTFAIAVANLLSLLFSQLEQQSLQAQLRHTQKLEALGTLAGGIAHDFNNILGAIISFTEIVRMDHPHDTELRENLGEVLKACNRATGLVRQILAFSRRQDPVRVRMQLEPVVREALRLIRSTLPASISIEENIADGLPSVLADSNQIHQVVVNLCANAEHAMRGNPGILKVSLEAKPGPGPKGSQWLQLSISDTGHGMSEAVLQRIFDPFFTTKGPGEGTGLGLAVVHGIIQEHKGTIEVESRPGAGTTFRISFPASESESRERVIDLPRRVPGTGQRILFVDDEVALLNSARPLLEHQGFRVDACANPGQALERLRQDPAHYDAVVSDLTMPGLSGLELAREIRSIAPRVPILIMTGYAGDLTTEGVKQLGLSELVLKPIDFAVLATKLAEACTAAKVGQVMRF